MGNQCSQMCSHYTQKDGESNDRVALEIDDQHKQVKIVTQKILKNRIQVTQFPTPQPHIQSRIEKLSKYHKSLTNQQLSTEQLKHTRKIYKCKPPINIVYMNLEDRSQTYPIGKCIIYKLKEGGEFAGYFQGVLKQNFVISIKNSIIVFSNGSYFEGISENQGRYLNENTGLKYEGGWANQMPAFQGKEKNNKGSYEGQYEKGQKHGKGKFIWADNTFYEGSFFKGLFSGNGLLRDDNQKYQYSGQFKNGQKHGIGMERTKKQRYIGEFAYGTRSGKGKLQIFEDQNLLTQTKLFQGEFYSNETSGKGTLYILQKSKAKQKVAGIWTRGKLTSIVSIQ